MSEVVLTDANFLKEVIKSDQPILVDFWAPWCGPCKMQGPILDELVKEIEGKARIGKLNVDEHPNAASEYHIMSIPTLLIFHNGKVVDQFLGVQQKEFLKKKLFEYVDR
jgi:thioredoxin 1